MKPRISLLVFGALALTAASAASARVSVSVGINPVGYGAYYAPPVAYQPDPYYAAPPSSISVADPGVAAVGGGRAVTTTMAIAAVTEIMGIANESRLVWWQVAIGAAPSVALANR